MKTRIKRREARIDDTLDRLYSSGENVPAGTYVSLDDGRLVHVAEGDRLPYAHLYETFYLRLRDSAEYPVYLHLVPGAA